MVLHFFHLSISWHLKSNIEICKYNFRNRCKPQIEGFNGSRYEVFDSLVAAQDYLANNGLEVYTGGSYPMATANRMQDTSNEPPVVPSSEPVHHPIENSANEHSSTLRKKGTGSAIIKMQRFGKHNFLVDGDGYVHVFINDWNGAPGLGVFFGDGHPL